jgi:hypothetical protein
MKTKESVKLWEEGGGVVEKYDAYKYWKSTMNGIRQMQGIRKKIKGETEI